MNWLIGGYYGLGNIGDELMCREIVQWLRELDPDSEIGVLMARDGVAECMWLPDGVIAYELPVGSLVSYLRMMKRVDGFIVGGGTCFHRFGVAGLYQNIAARVMGTKVLWLGIGADDLGSLKNRIKGRISLACPSTVTVRDHESAVQLQKVRAGLDIGVYPDLVFSMAGQGPDYSVVQGDGSDFSDGLVVAWRDLSPYVAEDTYSRLLKCAIGVMQRIVNGCGLSRIIVLNTADAVDAAACEELHSSLVESGSRADLVSGISIPEKLKLIEGAGAVLSARLHPLMLATFAKKPAFGLSYANKMDRFASNLDGTLVASIEQWLSHPDEVAAQAIAALIKPPKYRRELMLLSKDVLGHRRALEAFVAATN